MERKKRPFFIIGHNPNTIEEAEEYLRNGANALEPDIVYAEGQFYVCHHPLVTYKNTPTVIEYLQDLKAVLLAGQYNLSLIVWDIKTTNFDPGHFMDIVKENFSGKHFDGVTMLITHADDHNFLNRFTGRHQNAGIGLDESDLSPAQIERIFKDAGQQNFSYADGITTFLNKPGVYRNVTEALHCRNTGEPGSFGIIYTWVLSLESSLRKYLDTYIDGIMVDVGATALLKELIVNPPYNEVYDIAQNGYNPFTASPIPKYKLSVETKDKFLAGTDAKILFTLTGNGGQSLKSLPFDGSLPGALERGGISHVMLEGLDLGELNCLEVEALTGGLNDDWLPGKITIESACLKEKVYFIFNDSDKAEWVTSRKGKVIKFPGSNPVSAYGVCQDKTLS